MLSPGDSAPDFTLLSNHGEIRLRDEVGKGPVLLVFYPGDDTPVCTKQLCNYRDNPEVFAELGVRVLAINPQSASSHQSFAKKHDLPFPLLSDEGGVVCRTYGAMNVLGVAKRALVLVDGDQKVRWSDATWPMFHRSAADIRKALQSL